MNNLTPGPLARWLTGPRFSALPAPAALPAPRLSFEFFPPKTDKLEDQLWACIRRLEPLAPRFVSVTYGAGGSTQERTHATVARLVAETNLTPAAHLTCVGATREEVDEVARRYWAAAWFPRSRMTPAYSCAFSSGGNTAWCSCRGTYAA
jgi:methylenetetrahydrofolate reductase (NADPH)